MTGCKSGLIALMKKDNPNLKSVDCLIHQESLIAKLGVPDAKKWQIRSCQLSINVFLLVQCDTKVSAPFLKRAKLKSLILSQCSK
ncbi:MAG: hypothetical protein MHMPM18_004189 [Marteilia pararefringens]